MLVFTLVHASMCWYLITFVLVWQCWSHQLAMCPHVVTASWSYVPVIDILSHVSTFRFSHLVIYVCVDIKTCSCILMMIFSHGHLSPSYYSQVVICCYVDIHTWSCIILLIFTLANVSLYWYSHLFMFPAVNILNW